MMVISDSKKLISFLYEHYGQCEFGNKLGSGRMCFWLYFLKIALFNFFSGCSNLGEDLAWLFFRWWGIMCNALTWQVTIKMLNSTSLSLCLSYFLILKNKDRKFYFLEGCHEVNFVRWHLLLLDVAYTSIHRNKNGDMSSFQDCWLTLLMSIGKTPNHNML